VSGVTRSLLFWLSSLIEKGDEEMANAAERVYTLIKDTVEEQGVSLWDVRFLKEGASWYLRVFIDKEGGINIDDCTNVSHAIDPIIDEADPIDKSYYLEVCSCGIDRELTRPAHFEAMKGALIKRGDEVLQVGIMAAAKRVDTTGAGDFYAAGFLSALCEGLDLRQCGTLGAITAGKVIEVVGTTFGEDAWRDIFELREKVRNDRYLF
jgi:ribosome maturation factor RimP